MKGLGSIEVNYNASMVLIFAGELNKSRYHTKTMKVSLFRGLAKQ